MSNEEQGVYAKWARDWTRRPCPLCGQQATAYAQLFSEPAPADELEDTRQPIDEVYVHDGTNDCRRRPSPC